MAPILPDVNRPHERAPLLLVSFWDPVPLEVLLYHRTSLSMWLKLGCQPGQGKRGGGGDRPAALRPRSSRAHILKLPIIQRRRQNETNEVIYICKKGEILETVIVRILETLISKEKL